MFNVREAISFFKSKLGILLLLCVALGVLIFGFGDWRKSSAEKAEDPMDAPQEVLGAPVDTIQRITAGALPEPAPPTPAPTPPVSRWGEPATVVQEEKPAQESDDPAGVPAGIVPTGLVNNRIGLRVRPVSTPTPAPVEARQEFQNVTPPIRPFSERFAPFGRPLQCKLVFTVDSSRVETPVIGMVTEDLWWNGNLIIPAGSEVHGTAQTDREKGRIRAEGKWIIVLPGFSDILNGTEIVVDGVALARQEEEFAGQRSWGVLDGSFGLLGETIKSDKWAEVKLFAAEFLGAVANAVGNTNIVLNPNLGGSGGSDVTPILNSPFAGLQAGSQSVIDQFAQQILEEIKTNGFYTRVPGGTQFYLYVRQTIDITDARVGDSAAVAEEAEARRRRLEAQRREDEIRSTTRFPVITPTRTDSYQMEPSSPAATSPFPSAPSTSSPLP
jgi:hypothetical protein